MDVVDILFILFKIMLKFTFIVIGFFTIRLITLGKEPKTFKEIGEDYHKFTISAGVGFFVVAVIYYIFFMK